jgi:NADP-dependent 3-hydroxy acid dehydrogenase YdfG
VFGRAGTEATVFEANKQALLEAIGTTGLRIAIDLRKNTEMEGPIGAYAQARANSNEIISINAGNLSLEQLTAVALEEYGHVLDTRLSPSLESAGD